MVNKPPDRSPGIPSDDSVRVSALRVVRRGRTVIDDIDLTIRAGELTGLLGPSGCGKTTLMRSIVGLQQIAGGSVEVLDHPAGSAALRDRIGYVTQSPSVYDNLTVVENLRFFARVLGAPDDDVQRAIAEVDLGGHEDTVVAQMSGGQHNRVSLAVALIGAPDLLVLDEPTVGLDPVLRRDLWRLFHRLADDGATVLVSSHVMDEASRCDRLLLMRDGRILASETPQGLLDRTGQSDMEGAFLSLIDHQPHEVRP